MAFAVTGLAFVPGLFRYQLLDLAPVAWAAVVEGMNDAVLVIDREGRIVELNPAAERVAGRTAWEILGTRGGAGVCRLAGAGGSSESDRGRGRGGLRARGAGLEDSRGFERGSRGWAAAARPAGSSSCTTSARSRRAEQARVRMLREQAAPRRGRGGESGQGPVPGDPQPRAPHAPDADPRHRHRDARRSPRRPDLSAT